MHITELLLHTTKLAAQRAFFEQALGLQTIETNTNAFTVQAGTTRLTFQATEQIGITYHYAFTIARDTLASSKEWLRTHGISLLRDGEQEEFPNEMWNTTSIYFHDDANNIAEFIIHHALPDNLSGTFGLQDILRVSEIGLVVDDVPAQVIDFKNRLNLEPYKDSSNDFAAVGDAYGLFITAKRGRPWRPTTTERGVVAPVQVTIGGTSELSYNIFKFPYSIKVTAS